MLGYLHRFRDKGLVVSFALAALVIFLLVPIHPWGEGGHGLDEIDEATAKGIHDTFKIFSVLQSHRLDLAEPLAWDLAGTILEESEKYSLDPMLVIAVIKVESGFRPRAVSRLGARGLMQIRPFVADALAQQLSLESWGGKESLEEPITNIRLGVFYLGYLVEKFKDVTIALTAYQWGPTNIKTRLETEEPLPLEYAKKVLSYYTDYKQQGGRQQKALVRAGKEGNGAQTS